MNSNTKKIIVVKNYVEKSVIDYPMRTYVTRKTTNKLYTGIPFSVNISFGHYINRFFESVILLLMLQL